jgi:hypothetical protein
MLTEYTIDGLPVIQCAIHGSKSRCQQIAAPLRVSQ